MMGSKNREEEFRRFFESHADGLGRLGTFLTSNPEQGAELAQETLVRVYKQWGRIKDQDPGPYARRVLVNLVRSAHRRRIVERKHLSTVQEVARCETRHVDDWLRVSEALKSLPPMRRAAIVLRFYEDMPEAEIARVLDRPLGTIKSDIHRALAKLRPLLDETEKETL
jgi:RNA polymerase sigma-70 factor (sigma-E family)